MLQYPINVRPENIAIPTTNSGVYDTTCSFTFQGDYLSYVLYRVFDCATGSVVYDSAGIGSISGTPIAYNGDTYTVGSLSANNFLTSGHNYVVQFCLIQRTQNGQDNLYDMPCIGGTISATTGSSSSFVLEKDLPIYEWSSTHEPIRDANNVVAVGMVMKIGNEIRFIDSYNPSTGVINLHSPFSSTVTAGTRYKIYSNYLITPQYYFMCRNLPTITSSIEFDSLGLGHKIKCSATYVQQDNSMIKYYVATLYAAPYGTTKWYELAKTPKIYSQNIEHTFLDATLGVAPWGDSVVGGSIEDINYKVVFDIVTQENETYSSSAIMRLQSKDESFTPVYSSITFTPNKNTGCVDIDAVSSGTTGLYPIITRVNLENGEKEKFNIANGTHDYSVSANAKYEYIVVYVDSETGQPYVHYDENGRNTYAGIYDIETSSFDGYTITALEPIDLAGNHLKNVYQAHDTWHFICDIEDTTMTHNYDKHLQVGYGRYPAMTSTETNYLTGTLTTAIGQINCPTNEFVDTLTLVKAWREFISQPCPFLLKSPKGDIWIVNITDASTTYKEDTPQKFTTLSFSWAECDSIDNSIIYRGTWW